MGNKVKECLVVLDKDYDEEEMAPIINALKMIKGVADVSVEYSNIDDIFAISRAKNELKNQLMKVLL